MQLANFINNLAKLEHQCANLRRQLRQSLRFDPSEIFKQLDRDRTYSVNQSALEDFLTANNIYFTEAAAQYLHTKIDIDHDGCITYKDFLDYLAVDERDQKAKKQYSLHPSTQIRQFALLLEQEIQLYDSITRIGGVHNLNTQLKHSSIKSAFPLDLQGLNGLMRQHLVDADEQDLKDFIFFYGRNMRRISLSDMKSILNLYNCGSSQSIATRYYQEEEEKFNPQPQLVTKQWENTLLQSQFEAILQGFKSSRQLTQKPRSQNSSFHSSTTSHQSSQKMKSLLNKTKVEIDRQFKVLKSPKRLEF